MPRLPQLSARELIKFLHKYDSSIECRPGKGSHLAQFVRVVNGQKKFATVSGHGNDPLDVGTLKAVLRDLGIDESILRSGKRR